MHNPVSHLTGLSFPLFLLFPIYSFRTIGNNLGSETLEPGENFETFDLHARMEIVQI